jgi:hypothetical protein
MLTKACTTKKNKKLLTKKIVKVLEKKNIKKTPFIDFVRT